MKKSILVLLLIVSISFAVFAEGQKEQAAYPTHAIELSVNGGASGGSDILARTMVDIVNAEIPMAQPFSVVNKAGGGGAVCFAYVNGRSDVDYTLMTANSANILTMNITDCFSPRGRYVPIALVAMDNQCFVCSANSPFNTMDDVIAYMKANPKSETVGSSDDLDELAIVTLEKATGVEFNRTAYFSGSSEVATALLGGHIAFGILNPVECISLFEGGRVKVLGVFSPERLDSPFDAVPTFREMGYEDCVVQMFRGFMGAAGMSSEAQHYLSDIICKAASTETWKKNYIEKNILGYEVMGCDEFTAFLEDHEAKLIEFAKANGLMN